MNSSILAVRAVTSEYAKQLLWLALWVGLAVYGILLLLIGWIASSVSNWWWLLAFLPSLIMTILAIMWLIIWVLARRLAPEMNKEKKKAAKTIIDHIIRLAEHVGTPKFIIFYRLVKDVVSPQTAGRTYIGELTSEPGELHKEFEQLRRLF